MTKERRSSATPRRSRCRPRWVLRIVAFACLGPVVASQMAACGAISLRGDLAAKIATARTPADHTAIARELSTKANEYAAAAKYHRGLAAKYTDLAGPGAQYRSYDRSDLRMAEHCRKVAEDLERAANDLTELAHEHERLAASLQEKGP